MDVIAAFENVGTYRGAAEICGTTHKTVKRIVEAHLAEQAGEPPVERKDRGHNYDQVVDLVAQRVEQTQGKISAKRLLPAARVAGYAGSPRNFRRLVAESHQDRTGEDVLFSRHERDRDHSRGQDQPSRQRDGDDHADLASSSTRGSADSRGAVQV